MKVKAFNVNLALRLMREAVAKGRPVDAAHAESCARVRMNKAERDAVKKLYDEGKEYLG